MGKVRNGKRKPVATLQDLLDSQWTGGVIEHMGEEYRVTVRGGKTRAWVVQSLGGLTYRANVWRGLVDLELML